MRFLHAFQVVIVGLALTSVARADLIPVHDSRIIANGMAPDDGENLTLDPDTSLEWLDVPLSRGLSFNEAAAELGPGGIFEGFRFASLNDIRTLFFSTVGISRGLTFPPESQALDLIDFVGPTSRSNGMHVNGLFDSGGEHLKAGFAQVGWLNGPLADITDFGTGTQVSVNWIDKSETHSRIGVWLVRDMIAQPGDAGRDKSFDQGDLILVSAAGKYLTGEQAGWDEGDWNADGVFDQLDIVAALQTGNYLHGQYEASAIPEPTTFSLPAIGAGLLVFRRRFPGTVLYDHQ